MRQSIRKAVFPVGGLGTRFLPATKAMPKEMLPVVDKPLIQYAVEEAMAAGIEEFIFVTGRGKTAIEDHFDHSVELETMLSERGKGEILESILAVMPGPGQVSYLRQQKPLGLGHAVWCARNIIGNEPFAVLLADDLIQAAPSCLEQMAQAYSEVGGNVVAAMDVPRADTGRYGILDVGDDSGRLVEISAMVEKPDPAEAPSTLSVIGRYILQPQVFRYLERGETGAGGEIQLTDGLARMIGTMPFHGFRFAGRRFDCGDKVGFLEANVAMALERDDMKDGVNQFLKGL